MPGGWSFNHAEMLRTIDFYYNSKYKSGPLDNKGFRKFFFNITKPACDIATKFVDLDTKDIQLIPDKQGDELKVWLLQKRLKQWLKEKDFGLLLNTIVHDYPKYGHVVIKKSQGKWHKVNIHNLRLDPSSPTLDKSPFVYEVHVMAKHEIEQMNWDTNELFERGDDQTFIVYEMYEREGKKWKRTFKGDLFTQQTKDGFSRRSESIINDGEMEYAPAIVLDEATVSKLPYRELKWEEVPGRWLGFGFVEYLEDNQVAMNEAENLERKGLMYKALQIWQTRDETVAGSNVLTDVENGDILGVDQELTSLTKDNSDLSAYNNTRNNWTQNTVDKTFTSDITSGQNLPSRTPIGVANIQASAAASYFEFKRENLGLFLKKLILEDIIPDFKNANREQHTLTFLGSDEELEKLDKTVTEIKLRKAILKHARKTGFFPSKVMVEDARSRIREQLQTERNRYMKIPRAFYDDAKFIVDVLITGENQEDNGQMLQLALQTVGTNPAILQNRTTRAIFFKLLSISGVNPAELNMLAEDVDQQQVPQGGTPATPQPTQ